MVEYSHRDFLGKEHIETPADVLYLLYIAEELQKHGDILDVSGESLDIVYVKTLYIRQEFECRIQEGSIKSDIVVDPDVQNRYYLTSYFGLPESLKNVDVFNPETLEWVGDSVIPVHLKVDLYKIILPALAKHVVKVFKGEVPPNKLKGYVDIYEVTFQTELLAIFKAIPTVLKLTDITFHRQLNSTNQEIKDKDIDFDLFMYNLVNTRKIKELGIDAKYAATLKKIKPGGVYCLHHRGFMSDIRPEGKLDFSKLVRIDEITPLGIFFTSLNVHMTYEDLFIRFSRQPQNIQTAFADVLRTNTNDKRDFVSHMSVSLGDTIYNEEYILLPLTQNIGKHYILEDGFINIREMSEPEVALYALNQWGYSIDNKLFVDMYGLDSSWLDLAESGVLKSLTKAIRKSHFPVVSL